MANKRDKTRPDSILGDEDQVFDKAMEALQSQTLEDEDILFQRSMLPQSPPANPPRLTQSQVNQASTAITPQKEPDVSFEELFDAEMGRHEDDLPAEAQQKIGMSQEETDRLSRSLPTRTHMRGIARGIVSPDAIIDLHGQTRDGARRLLGARLKAERARGSRVLLVITGKGLHSKGLPVLREDVPRWLLADLSSLVRQVIPAPKKLGGQGAWLVTLQRS